LGDSRKLTLQINTEFVLYMAENLAVLDYQHQEEVMLLIQYLSRLVSDNGAAVANALDLGAVDGTGVGLIAGKMTIVSVAEQFPATRVANASIVVALAILTKNFLLCLYNLQEE
jgi:cohesin loading factor subunit SCC2